MEYYRQWDCPQFDHENFELCLNVVERNGRPVFDYMMFEQEYVTCKECDCSFGTGDIDAGYAAGERVDHIGQRPARNVQLLHERRKPHYHNSSKKPHKGMVSIAT